MTAASPFSRRAVLAMVLFGTATFLLLLYMTGTGLGSGAINNGGAHAGSRGVTGYAALADYLGRRGYTIDNARTGPALEAPGLLVLTPPAEADGDDIAEIVASRRTTGPTLVIAPKWLAAPVAKLPGGAGKQGFVTITGTQPPEWPGFRDDLSVALNPMRGGGRVAGWRGAGQAGALPVSEQVQSGSGSALIPLVLGSDGRVLAGFIADDGYYPALENISPAGAIPSGEDDTLYPLIMVFEPDLLNNYGFADAANAVLAQRLVDAALDGEPGPVIFDLTLNGLGRSANLLALAFTPPFLAATLCLLLAALAAGWRAFHRFGAPAAEDRAIGFGKAALVANAAGLIRRSGRLALVRAPYADALRERLARSLALPHGIAPAAADAAIDRALAARAPDMPAFSATGAALRAAPTTAATLRSAQALHAIERTLTR